MAKWQCTVCKHIHEGDLPADFKCPVCKQPAEKFAEQGDKLTWAAEHVVGVAQGAPEEIMAILSDAGKYQNIRFRGIMGMATFTDDESVIRSDFAALRDIFDKVREKYPSLSDTFTELSIGMSDDYPVALEYGSTMVRIGSMIFGQRI